MVSLIPPPWLRRVVEITAPNVHPQIQVVLEAYASTSADTCPFTNPTLECDDCGTRVMLQESLTRPLIAEWWEIVHCHHVRGHERCLPTYQAHSRRRCRIAQVSKGRSPLPWIFDGT